MYEQSASWSNTVALVVLEVWTTDELGYYVLDGNQVCRPIEYEQKRGQT